MKFSFQINGEEIEWSSSAGQNLKSSQILSISARKFAIAQRLYLLNSYQYLIKGCYTSSLIILASTASINYIKKLELYNKPRIFRLSLYAVASLFTFMLWAVGNDSITCMYEKKSDEVASNINVDYIKGGVDFYEKILQRNIALRTLMGSEGESIYSAYGNVQVSFSNLFFLL